MLRSLTTVALVMTQTSIRAMSSDYEDLRYVLDSLIRRSLVHKLYCKLRGDHCFGHRFFSWSFRSSRRLRNRPNCATCLLNDVLIPQTKRGEDKMTALSAATVVRRLSDHSMFRSNDKGKKTATPLSYPNTASNEEKVCSRRKCEGRPTYLYIRNMFKARTLVNNCP